LQPGIVQTDNILGHNSGVERQKNHQNTTNILSRNTLGSFGRARIEAGWPRNRGSIPGRSKNSSVLKSVQISSETQLAYYLLKLLLLLLLLLLLFYGATARGRPWPPFQYASKPLDPLLYLSIRLFPSFSCP
jgi:hypothetical protein